MSETNLNMNYEPEVIVDTDTLSREDWLSYRKLGIGGSDVAAIMGISPFATIRDLYNDNLRGGWRRWLVDILSSQVGIALHGSGDLCKEDWAYGFPGAEDVPASAVSIYAGRCGFLYHFSRWFLWHFRVQD